MLNRFCLIAHKGIPRELFPLGCYLCTFLDKTKTQTRSKDTIDPTESDWFYVEENSEETLKKCGSIGTELKRKMFAKLWLYSTRYPVVKGMVAYAVIWPLGSCIQQKIAGNEKIDFGRAARFALYGSCYVAPTLYLWVRISSRLWPNPNFRTAVKKALVEQVSYGPAAMVSFFFGMTLLEGGSIEDAKNEVQAKFLSTYKVGICVWPILQTINFAFVPERNRVVFVSICSLIWTSFLAYMKQLERERQFPEKLGEVNN